MCGCTTVSAVANATDQSAATQITLISVLVIVDVVPNLDKRVARLRARHDFLRHQATYHCFGPEVTLADFASFFSLTVVQSSNFKMRVAQCGRVLSVVLPCNRTPHTASVLQSNFDTSPLVDFFVATLEAFLAMREVMYRRAAADSRSPNGCQMLSSSETTQ